MNEIMTAVYSRLDGQLSTPVYDHIPQDTDYPFVQMVALNLDMQDTDNELAFNGTLDIVAHSDYRGSKEVNTISDSIYTALHRYAMPDTATYGVISIHREFYTVVSEGETKQGLNRYRIIFETL